MIISINSEVNIAVLCDPFMSSIPYAKKCPQCAYAITLWHKENWETSSDLTMM